MVRVSLIALKDRAHRAGRALWDVLVENGWRTEIIVRTDGGMRDEDDATHSDRGDDRRPET
jgi:hypothetical protein